MNPLQQIDFVFFYLKDKVQYGAYYGYNNIWFYIEKTPELEINQVMFREILDRLIADGFITEKKDDETQPFYNITFKGLLFEGYEKESQRVSQLAQISSDLAKGNWRNGKTLNLLTVILAIGTSIAAIYYLMEIVKYLGLIPSNSK